MRLKILKISILSLLLALAFYSFLNASGKNDIFILGGLKVAPGEKQSNYLSVPVKDGITCSLPMTVINGLKKGKVLALVAGVHGYEYPPILALYRIKEMIDAKDLSGTLILVYVANVPSFQKRTIYYNPYDWKNLNRVFPGDSQGTLSQRIAYVLNTEVIKKCDYLIDLHCGDGNEALIPYTYWMISDNKKLDETTRKMALAFGIKHIIIDESRTKVLAQSKYLGNTAILQSKPAITTESGYLGRTDEEAILTNIRGIMNVMKWLQMIEGKPEFIPEPVWIDKYEVIYSNHDGIFYPQAMMGETVSEGQKVGYVTDFLGNVVEEVKAPFAGILLYIINTPPANKGEPLFEVGRVKRN